MKSSVHSDLNGFKKICKVSELSEKCGKRFIIDSDDSLQSTDIALFKVNEKIHAVSNVCPHQHTTLIYDGFIEDECIVCPVHGWMFDLQSGETRSGNGRLEVYEVKIIDDEIFVKVNSKKWQTDW